VRTASAADVLGWVDEGAPKLWLISRTLDVRRRFEASFAGGYQPLPVAGAQAANVVAYLRAAAHSNGDVAVIVPRLVMGLRDGWGDTTVELPPGRWVDELGGSTADEGPVSPAALLSGFPVALMVGN